MPKFVGSVWDLFYETEPALSEVCVCVREVFVHVVRVFLGKDFINSFCGQV